MKGQSEQVVILAARKCLHGVKFSEPVEMEYCWIEKDRRRDKSNISSFGRKVIEDALVKTHYLKNDGWDDIERFSDEFKVDKKNPRIEVRIREIER